MRWLNLTIAALLLAWPVQAELRPYGSERVTLQPLPKAADPKPLNARVSYAGGYQIFAHGTSQIMGLSDLEVTADGQITALSDLGAVVSFSLGGGAVRIDLLRDRDGKTSINRDYNDAEDLALAPDGTRYVSYERMHRIMVYKPGVAWNGTPAQLAVPGLPGLPNNEGLEGLAYVGGQLLAGAESGGFWLCGTAAPGCKAIDGPAVPGFMYKLVSLAPLPGRDDEVLALYRFYSPFSTPRAILTRLRLKDGRLVKIDDLARVPLAVADNYEGVAAVKTDSGYRLYLISDSLQDDGRPRLLMFDWKR
ncbi:esterase-like activity of phytase family protein [Asticcacaulis sp. AC402]|uniref:esterase-like activity of phytase family protein n=1 Tax=Asticcacaulis sp. AC402 TaxID=1282361 RepID=UPI0003C3ACAF|nr:esterase-like activity of phytase family protein [Asticcacaulis sp. AC402]ESQ77571.1 hypothetical protein ABAC402_00145 [Asticcacaulis sp. AC402]